MLFLSPLCSKLNELTEQVSALQAACKSAEARYEKASEQEETLAVRVQELKLEKEDVSMDSWILLQSQPKMGKHSLPRPSSPVQC